MATTSQTSTAQTALRLRQAMRADALLVARVAPVALAEIIVPADGVVAAVGVLADRLALLPAAAEIANQRIAE